MLSITGYLFMTKVGRISSPDCGSLTLETMIAWDFMDMIVSNQIKWNGSEQRIIK